MNAVFNNPFAMIFLIVAIATVVGAIKEMYKMRLEHRSANQQLTAALESLTAQVEKIERRMANLESIVIEREKENTFRDALDGER